MDEKIDAAIGQPALSHLESHQRSIDNFETRAFAAIDGVSVAWLFEEDPR
ncbi:MAG: hypothetical protein QNL04_00285 [SAR324 cluster bacterium]|nr:hypothetical protein [SAR324 cluster bacterium]